MKNQMITFNDQEPVIIKTVDGPRIGFSQGEVTGFSPEKQTMWVSRIPFYWKARTGTWEHPESKTTPLQFAYKADDPEIAAAYLIHQARLNEQMAKAQAEIEAKADEQARMWEYQDTLKKNLVLESEMGSISESFKVDPTLHFEREGKWNSFRTQAIVTVTLYTVVGNGRYPTNLTPQMARQVAEELNRVADQAERLQEMIPPQPTAPVVKPETTPDAQ